MLNLLPTYILSKYNPALVNAQLGLIWVIVAVAAVAALQFGTRSFAPRRALIGLTAGVLLVTAAVFAAERVGPGILGQAELKPGALKMDIVPAKFHHPPARPLASPAGAVQTARGVSPALFLWGQYLTLPAGVLPCGGGYLHSLSWTGDGGLDGCDPGQGPVELAKREMEGSEAIRPVGLEFVLPVGARRWRCASAPRAGPP